MNESKQINSLIEQIGDEKFDGIMTCGRGGLVMAAYLAHALGIKQVHHLTNARAGKTPGMYNQETKFLIVDDISDTGETFKMMLRDMGPKHKTAALFQRYSTEFKCDFVGLHINHDKWLNFSWEGKHEQE